MPTGLQPASIVDGRFVLEAEAKRGGMGTVWKARDLHSAQPVAFKLLHDQSPEQCRRFLRERQLLAGLSHPQIVSYLAHGTLGPQAPYLVMEWLDGETLAERLARAPLSLEESLTVLRVSLSGLACAHRRGIVHRDLKPSNLFLRRGRLDDVVLLDLGLARYAGSEESLTRTGSILGTPSYMAPEQAQDGRDVGSAADVFSLGCVLFECLTGASPFVGAQLMTVLAKVLFQPTPRLAELRPELPAVLDALLARMLEKDPKQRVPDADTLLAELDALGPLPSVQAPSGLARLSAVELELVGVILVDGAPSPDAGLDLELGGETLAAPGAPPEAAWAAVAAYGGECKHMADGTTIVIVAQRGGAATDLTARTARCALHMRRLLPERCYALAIGRGFVREDSFAGDAVERAGIMLRAVADRPSGAIWLDETTAGLLDARFRRRRAEHGIVIFELEGEEHSVDPARPLLGRPTPCVGRERELGVLALALHAAIEDASPQATLVIGPAGIGKSRLRHEFLRRSQLEQELTVLLGLGDPIRSVASCGMIGQALGRLCGLRSDASLEANHAALAARIGANLDGDRELTTTFIAELCGLPELPSTRPELRAARQQPDLMTERLTQSWLRFVRVESARNPLVIVLDDLQWSDSLTLTLIDATLRQSDSRVMVLALGRPETLELFPELWAPRLATLPLQPLSAAATRRLVREVLGEQFGAERVDRIIAHAGGNALYLEELIRAAESGRASTPETVLAMLQARIGLLPPAARRVLRSASVFGEHFPVAGVESLLAGVTPQTELQPLLALLIKNELLEPLSAERSGAQLRFRHALLRDAAYALISAEELRAVHSLAAAHLESTDEEPAVIAAHCERGGDASRAIHHYALAARRANRRNDGTATLELIERCANLGASGAELGTLRSIECLARFFHRHDFPAAWQAARAALELLPSGHPRRPYAVATATFVALQMGHMAEVTPLIDELLAGEPGEDDHSDLARAIGYASIVYVIQADRVRARRLIARIAELNRSSGIDDVLVRGQLRYWEVRFEVLLGDDPLGALEIARRGAADLEVAGDLQIGCAMWAEIGECTRRARSLTRSLPELRKAVDFARAGRERVATAFVSSYLASALADVGTPEAAGEAHAICGEILELTAPGSIYRALGNVACTLAHLATRDYAAAEGCARSAHAEMHALGLHAYYPHVDNALIRALLASGDVRGAAAVADEALRNADTHGPLGLLEPAMRVAAARARRAAGRHADAIDDVQRAWTALRRKLAKLEANERAGACAEVPENAELLALADELGLRLET